MGILRQSNSKAPINLPVTTYEVNTLSNGIKCCNQEGESRPVGPMSIGSCLGRSTSYLAPC